MLQPPVILITTANRDSHAEPKLRKPICTQQSHHSMDSRDMFDIIVLPQGFPAKFLLSDLLKDGEEIQYGS